MNVAENEYKADWAPSIGDPAQPFISGHNSVLGALLDDLQPAFPHVEFDGIHVGSTASPAVFPSPALTLSTSPGFLILFDYSFLTALPNAAWIIAAALPDPEGNSPLGGPDGGTAALRRYLTTYVRENVIRLIVEPSTLPEGRANYAKALARYAAAFILAHELGHVADGHAVTPVEEVIRTERGATAMVNPLSHVDEMEADRTGALALSTVSGPHERKHELGATVALELLQTIDALYWYQRPKIRDTAGNLFDPAFLAMARRHPGYSLRLATLLQAMDPQRAVDTQELDIIVELMWRVRGEPRPRRDPAVLQKLGRIARSVDPGALAEFASTFDLMSSMYTIGQTSPVGLRPDRERVERLVRAERRCARALVALMALRYVSVGFALKRSATCSLAAVYGAYARTTSDGALRRLVHSCVPNMDDVMHENEQRRRGELVSEADVANTIAAVLRRSS